MDQANLVTFTPLGLAILFLGGAVILAGPRRWVIPAFITVVLLVSTRQHMLVLGFNFTPPRTLLLLVWFRIFSRGEHRGFQPGPIDKVLLLLFCWTATAYVLLRGGSFEAIKFYLGECYDALGLFFMFRVLIRSREDMLDLFPPLGAICMGLAVLMVWEGLAHTSPLTVIGGIWEVVEERKGHMRCRAAFGHPVMAGLVGATLLPIWIACWWQEMPLRKWAVRGAFASTVIVLAAGSSTPLGAYMAAWLGLCLWRWRHRMRFLRWGLVFALIGLQLVMKAHVWDLLARVDIVGGNSAYHRSHLIEEFYQHFGEWWALGTISTDSWGWDMWDVSDYYLYMGKRGGFVPFILFITMLGLCFREVGRTVGAAEGDRPTQILAWSFGAALFSHCVAFFGCAYWDQFMVFWYLMLAMLASVRLLAPATVPISEVDPEVVVASESSPA
jgi:hypothetical protein